MPDAPEEAAPSEKQAANISADKSQAQPRRQIPGNLPYLTASGTLKTILNKIVELAKPEKFNYDFLNNVVKLSGGGARACIPILKKMDFLNSDNTPTELYSKFRTESGRSAAAYQGLRNAFPEIFKRSDYAHSLEEAKLRDIILEITGLKANDTVSQAIKSTFNVIKSYIANGFNHADLGGQNEVAAIANEQASAEADVNGTSIRGFGIAYNINILVPETSDLVVLNAIFRSVRENLLR